MDAYVEITRDDGSSERMRIKGDQTTLGRSPSAGIPIPDARELELEHLLLSPRDDGCWVAIAKGARTPIYVHGEDFDHGVVAWGTELQVGSLSIRLLDEIPREIGGTALSPVVRIALLLAIPLLIWLLWADPPSEFAAATVAPPSLLTRKPPCSTHGGPTKYRGDQCMTAATAKGQRYAFSAQDGVEAVKLYWEASACYSMVGDAEAAAKADRLASRLKTRIEEDYQSLRLRLDRSLRNQRYPDAYAAAGALRELLVGEEKHPYVGWLEVLERQLSLRMQTRTETE